MVQVFRRAESVYEAARLRLRGLDPDARYTLTDLDTGATSEATGRELGERGLPVSIPAQPGVAVMAYERVN